MRFLCNIEQSSSKSNEINIFLFMNFVFFPRIFKTLQVECFRFEFTGFLDFLYQTE